MTLLDGGLTRIFGAAFGAIYPKGRLYRAKRKEAIDGGVTKTFADPVEISVQIDSVTENMRREAGYTEKDVALIVLQAGCRIAPNSDDVIVVGSATWAVANVKADAANTHWVMRGTPA